MKRSIPSRTFLSVFFLSFLIVALLLQAQEMKIKKEDGVTVIYNPKTPAPPPGTPTRLILKEDLTIGEKEGKEEYMFIRLRSFDVDEKGNIYVLDSKECHIKVFDKNGKYLRTFGRKGQGPGEMLRPLQILVTLQKGILVNDWNPPRLLFFTLDGKFLKQVSAAKMMNFITQGIDSEGNIVASFTVMGAPIMSELRKLTPELEPIFTIARIELYSYPVVKPFFSQFFWKVTKENNIIWGISDKYELQIINPDGKLIKKIVKDYDPVKITEKEKEEWIKSRYRGNVPPEVKFEWPKHYWAFVYLNIDDEGRIFLRTFEKAEDGESYYYDVFNSEGRYIAKIPFKFHPFIWKKDKMYTIHEDEEGYRFVKRYSVEWK